MGLRGCLRHPEMLDLASFDELFHRPGDIFDRNLAIDAMLVEEVDAIGAQTLQRRISNGADALRPAVLWLRRVPIPETKFGGDDDLIPDGRKCLAEEFLVGEGTIGLGRIEERHALLERGTDQLDRILLFGRGAVAVAEAHAAKAKCRYVKASAQGSHLHGYVLSMMQPALKVLSMRRAALVSLFKIVRSRLCDNVRISA